MSAIHFVFLYVCAGNPARILQKAPLYCDNNKQKDKEQKRELRLKNIVDTIYVRQKHHLRSLKWSKALHLLENMQIF